MIVRSHLPWPLRWVAAALVFGFSAAIALWAFEFGKEIAGLDRHAREELEQLRAEVGRLRTENERALAVANSADSLLKAERAAQERLGQTVRQLQAEAETLKADLGFFERLLPANGTGAETLVVRGLQADSRQPGQVRWQMLVMQQGKDQPEFAGRYDILAQGQMAGKPWTQGLAGGPREMRLKQYARLEGLLELPPEAVVRSLQVKVTDAKGALRATQTVRL